MQVDRSYSPFKNYWIKYSTILLLGIFIKFISDVIFSLIYRNFELMQPIRSYFAAILITWAVVEVVLLASKRISKRYTWKDHLPKRLIIQLSTTIILALLIAEVLRWILISLFTDIVYIKLMDELIIAFIITLFSVAFVFVQLEIFLLNRWRLSLSEIEKFRKENVEIRFETLRAQVNPHFLFNSLNTLSSLVYTDQAKAEVFIRELSDVYRYILDKRETDLIDLEDELKFLRSFIFLIKLRFENNLIVSINVDEHYQSYQIIPISLQLLVENAVKHNIVSAKKPLKVDIHTDSQNYIVITNNLQVKESEKKSTGFGQKNIRSRYAYITSRPVVIGEGEKSYTVKLPLIKNDENTDR